MEEQQVFIQEHARQFAQQVIEAIATKNGVLKLDMIQENPVKDFFIKNNDLLEPHEKDILMKHLTQYGDLVEKNYRSIIRWMEAEGFCCKITRNEYHVYTKEELEQMMEELYNE